MGNILGNAELFCDQRKCFLKFNEFCEGFWQIQTWDKRSMHVSVGYRSIKMFCWYFPQELYYYIIQAVLYNTLPKGEKIASHIKWIVNQGKEFWMYANCLYEGNFLGVYWEVDQGGLCHFFSCLIFQNFYVGFEYSSLIHRIWFLHITFCLFSTLYSYSTSKCFYLWSRIQSGSWLLRNRNPSDNFFFAKSLFNVPLGDAEYFFSGMHTKPNWCDLGLKAKLMQFISLSTWLPSKKLLLATLMLIQVPGKLPLRLKHKVIFCWSDFLS